MELTGARHASRGKNLPCSTTAIIPYQMHSMHNKSGRSRQLKFYMKSGGGSHTKGSLFFYARPPSDTGCVSSEMRISAVAAMKAE